MNFLKSGWSYLSSSFSQSESDANESIQELDVSQSSEVENAADALEVQDQYDDPSIPIEADELNEFADALDTAPLQNKNDADAQPGLQASSASSQESNIECSGILQSQYFPDELSMVEAEVKDSVEEVASGELAGDDIEIEEGGSTSAAAMEKTTDVEENVSVQGYTSLEPSDSDDSGEFIPPPARPVGSPTNTESQLNEIINNLGGDLDILTLEDEEHSEQNHPAERTVFVTAYDHTVCPSSPETDCADVTIGSSDKLSGNKSPDSAIASSSKSSLPSIGSVKFDTEFPTHYTQPSPPDLITNGPDVGFNEAVSDQLSTTSLLDVTVEERLTDSQKDQIVDPALSISAVQQETSRERELPRAEVEALGDKKDSLDTLENPASASITRAQEEPVAFAINQSQNSSHFTGIGSALQHCENLPLDAIPQQRMMEDLNDEIPLPIPKGAYTIDFDNLDDFNPFQSKKAIQNSPDVPSKPFPGIQAAQEPEIPQEAPKEKNISAKMSNHISEDTNASVASPDAKNPATAKENSAILDQLPSKSSSEKLQNKMPEPKIENSSKPEQTNDMEMESIPVSRGSYSLDLDNLDNMDPFKTSKGLQNSPTMPKATSFSPKSPVKNNIGLLKSMTNSETPNVLPEPEKKKPVENEESVPKEPASTDLITIDLENMDPSSKKEVVKKPVLGANRKKVTKPKSLKKKPAPFKPQAQPTDEEDEVIIPKGSYSINFDDLENMDPFKTSKGIANSPTKKSGESFPMTTQAVIEDEPKPVEESPGKGSAVDSVDLPVQKDTQEILDDQLPSKDPVQAESEVKKAPVKKKQGAVKKKVKKPPVIEAPLTEVNNDEGDIPIPKGSYNLNFDDLDSMDPFKTTKGLANSPTEKQPGYSMDFDNLDSVDPFKPSKAMANSPPPSPTKLTVEADEATSEAPAIESAESIRSIPKVEDVALVKEEKQPDKKVVKKSRKKPSPVKAPPPEPDNNDADEIPVPKGSYNVNFDDLDAIDPFKSKGLANSPTEKKPSGYSMDFDNLDAMDPFKPSKAMANSPPGSPKIQTESQLVQKGPATTSEEATVEETSAPGDGAEELKTKPETGKKVTKKTGPVRKKVKKPKPIDALPSEPNNDAEEIPIPKGSYNINFDDLDALDPFKSSKGLSNSPTEKKPAGYPVDFDNLDAVDPFKPSKGVANSPPGSPKIKPGESQAQPQLDGVTASETISQPPSEASGAGAKEVEKKPEPEKKPKKKTTGLARKKLLKPSMKKPPVDDNATDEQPPPLPKGAYNIDFDNLDALDPFKSSKGMSNSPTKESAPAAFSCSENLDHLDSDPFKPKKAITNSPPDSRKGSACQESKNDTSLSDSVFETSAMREAPGGVDVDAAFQTTDKTPDSSAPGVFHDSTSVQGVEEASITKDQDEEFYPASSVFQDSASLAYLDKLGDEKVLTARDLRKQSLYVKFDPLVSASPQKLISQQISQNYESAGGDASNVITNKTQKDLNLDQSVQVAPSAVPANVSASLDHHTSMDSYNQSFMNQQSYGSSALQFTQADFDKAVRSEEQKWEKEKSEILARESTLKSELEQMSNVVKEYDRLFKEMSSGGGTQNGMLTREQQLLKAEHEQSLEDMAALERHHEDLCRRYNRLKTVVAQFRQNEDILKRSAEEMMEEAKATEKKYISLKVKADEEIKKATDELQSVKANAQQEVARAQAQLKMLELRCESLQSQIKDCHRENDELTKLCDDLIACSKQEE